MARKLRAFVAQGQELREITVTDEGSSYREKKTGNEYAAIGSPKLLIRPFRKPETIVLLSWERAASYDPPKDREAHVLGADGFSWDPPTGSSTVPLQDPNDPKRTIEVRVTPELNNALGIENAAKALAAAQKPPFWLMAAMVGAGIGLGWVLKMTFEVVQAKVAAGGA